MKEMTMGIESPEISKNEVVNEIRAIMQQVQAMGANDDEVSILNTLLENVMNDKLAPQAGVEKARAIRDNKQDYH